MAGIQKHHVFHGTLVIAIVAFVAVAVGLLVDALQTNRTYDTLAAHHVVVTGHAVACVSGGGSSRGSEASTRLSCQVDYREDGRVFTQMVASQATYRFVVDPQDPAIRMLAGPFANGPTEVVGDIVLALVFVGLAVAVIVVHEVHRYRRHPPSGRA